jgi:bifunctional non-homologous end joining protein LigD
VRLQSANLLDVTARWPELGSLPEGVNADAAVLDGEVVALDKAGKPHFQLLQQGEVPRTYVIFDVLSANGRNTMDQPYERRRALLADIVETGPHWMVPAHHIGGGAELSEASRQQDLEGIVAKRLGSTYQPGKRSPLWRKIKNRHEQELVIAGWTDGTGNRSSTFGSLLVGVYDGDALRYAGGVGTGFNQKLLESLLARLKKLEVKKCPFDPVPPRSVTRSAHWTRPELVAQVHFAEWTDEGIVRQSSFLGLRDDKDPHKVVREPEG